MIIRNAQIDELGNVPMLTFEDEMVEHLAEFSPELFNVIKEEQMRIVVRYGIKQADQYGFNFRGPIRLYLELMLLFGGHFDTDPQYPWAIEILKEDAPQMERAEKLHEKTLEYQDKVSGPDAANTRKALNGLLSMARNTPATRPENFEADIRREMARVFPQKTNYIGEEGITALINEGSSEAAKYGFPTVRGKALIIILMFAFGHGCTDDLLYPWISRTLNDERIVDSEARAVRLEKKATTWLEHVLDNRRKGE
jgi:hypothetical protein